MIEFTDQRSGVVVGVVAARGTTLLSDSAGESVAATWLARGGKPSEFENAYDNWTNGYVVGKRTTNDPAVVDNMRVVM